MPAEEAPRDPSVDRGWAWVVTAAVCIINIITLGSIRCLGILVNNASMEFSINKRDSSVIFSVTYVTFMLSSILFIGLTRVVSSRVLVFAGGLLISGGLCLAYFLPTPAALASGTAVLLGLGLSASQNPSVLLLNQYFERFRSRANGIAFAGGPIGSFLVPPLLTHLMIAYAFRGAMLLWGGLALHVCAAACLLRPKPPPPPPSPPPPQSQTLPSPPSPPQSPSSPLSNRAYGASLDSLLMPYAEDGAETVADDNDDDVENNNKSADATFAFEEKAEAGRPLTPAAPAEGKRKFGATLAASCGFEARLFRMPAFYAIGAVVTLGLCGLTLSFYIVPLHGREIGLDSTTTSLFLLLQGIPDLLSRLLAGFVTDKKLLTHLRLVWLCLLCQGAAWFLLLATPSYAGLLFFAAACGLCGGVVIASVHPLAISQLGLANYKAAFATYSILHGCWMLCLPILLGHIFDKTNSWRLAIAFVGFLLAVAGTTGLLLDVSQALRRLTHRVVGRLWRRP